MKYYDWLLLGFAAAIFLSVEISHCHAGGVYEWQCEVDPAVIVRAHEALGENTPAERTPGQDKEKRQ